MSAAEGSHPEPASAASTASQGELKRALGYWELVIYGHAYIAPFAPLSTIGFVWDASNGLIVLAYLLSTVCVYFTAKSYATMTGTVTTAGSVYGFARYCLGPFAGLIAGWMILLDYLLIPAFIYVLMSVALGTLMPEIDRSLWIILLTAGTLLVNWFGVTVTSRVNFVSVGIQILVLGLFLALALMAIHAGKGSGALSIQPLFDPAKFDAGKVIMATSICIMSFLGFDAISTLAEEVKDGNRSLVGKAIITVLMIAAAIFIGTAWILGNLMPGFAFKDPAAAAYELAAWAVAGWMAALLAWINATIVGITNAISMQVGVARVLFAMGRDRQLPAILGRVHPRYGTPHVAMLLSTAVAFVLAIAMRNKLDELATFISFGALSGFLLLHLSVLVHFGIKQRSTQWFVHWAVPLCGLAVVLLVLWGMNAHAIEVGLAWLLVGVIYGAVMRRR